MATAADALGIGAPVGAKAGGIATATSAGKAAYDRSGAGGGDCDVTVSAGSRLQRRERRQVPRRGTTQPGADLLGNANDARDDEEG